MDQHMIQQGCVVDCLAGCTRRAEALQEPGLPVAEHAATQHVLQQQHIASDACPHCYAVSVEVLTWAQAVAMVLVGILAEFRVLANAEALADAFPASPRALADAIATAELMVGCMQGVGS